MGQLRCPITTLASSGRNDAMSEPIGEPTPEPEPGLEPDADQLFDLQAAKRLRAENQKLRHRLREAEANRQTAEEARAASLARAAAMERQLVEHEVSELLADPSDLWAHTDEATQQSWVDQQFGELVPDAVRDSARAIIESRPHLARRTAAPPTARPIENLRPGAIRADQSRRRPGPPRCAATRLARTPAVTRPGGTTQHPAVARS